MKITTEFHPVVEDDVRKITLPALVYYDNGSDLSKPKFVVLMQSRTDGSFNGTVISNATAESYVVGMYYGNFGYDKCKVFYGKVQFEN